MTEVSELGRRLQLVHAAQWMSAAQGDPFAKVLIGYEDDPGPAYSAIREQGPLVRSRDGVWVTARNRVAKELLDHPNLGARMPDGRRTLEPAAPLEDTVLMAEREELDRLAGSSGPPLGADAAIQAGYSADEACRRIFGGLGADTDIMAAVAERVPAEVLADLCELSGPDRTALAESVRWAGLAQDSLLCPQALGPTRRMLTAIDDLYTLVGAPGPEQGSGEAGMLQALLGLPIATDLIANTLLALLTHPGQWSKVVADPWQSERAVTETLRYDPPVHLQGLVAHEDLEVAGTIVPAGDRVVVLVGGANRDPDAFPEPAGFEMDRPAAQSPALTPGWAYELAAPFAHAVAEATVRAMADGFPRLGIAGPPVRRRRAPVTRRLLRLPVTTRASVETV